MGENKNTVETDENIYKNYNYVGVKESVAYVFNDFSNTFNINAFNDRYIWDVVKVDFGINAFVNLFTSTWDIINDIILAAVVDNTRTRLGKFRPYLVGLQIPLTLFGLLYWFIPYFFPGSAGTFIPKLIMYYAFSVINETANTAVSIAKGGYMSTITPNPNERIRLITLAEALSGYLGEDMPRYLFGVVYDLINNGKLNIQLRSAFLSFGLVTSLVSCFFTYYFFIISKERVPQSVERPDIKSGLKAIFSNYPVLLMCLSDFLGGFAVGSDESTYFIDVLGSVSLITLSNIPSSMNGTISYTFVGPLRRKFSSRTLWVGADIYGDMLNLAYFLFGVTNKNYTKRLPMCIALGTREWFNKWAFGVNKVINADLWNEAMDYCEWKNGYRMEAATSVAKSLVLKIQSALMTSVKSLLFKRIGYVQGLKIGTQDSSTKFWLFALCTVVPLVTGALGIVPKFLWPLSKEKRSMMYASLAERREAMVDKGLRESMSDDLVTGDGGTYGGEAAQNDDQGGD